VKEYNKKKLAAMKEILLKIILMGYLVGLLCDSTIRIIKNSE
jgi:hypothetical protein